MIKALLFVTHLGAGALGVALGIYLLPILTAPASPTQIDMQSISDQALYQATFERDRQDSDFLHWGEGNLFISNNAITLQGKLAPGPDYRLYLSPTFIETEEAFHQHKAQMVDVGAVNTFNNFRVDLPAGTHLEQYNTVIVWCRAFNQYISSAQFKTP